jgi:glyoxylase-like metal-dependent hydrolase (beta-lactamase superfamily II)
MLARLAAPAGNPPLGAEAATLDANRNGLLERSEASGSLAAQFPLLDYNRDNVVSGAEFARGPLNDVFPPTITFTDRHTVTLAGKTVTVLHLGVAHTNDSSVLHFPAERAVFGADVLQVRRLPLGLTPTVGSYLDALRTINAIDYDHALTGHALAGTKKDALASQQYLEDLSTGVAAGIAAGRSLAEIQKSLQLEAYKGFERWDTHREAHIATVYATIKGTPADATAATR